VAVVARLRLVRGPTVGSAPIGERVGDRRCRGVAAEEGHGRRGARWLDVSAVLHPNRLDWSGML
jgi:hypothetical protein